MFLPGIAAARVTETIAEPATALVAFLHDVSLPSDVGTLPKGIDALRAAPAAFGRLYGNTAPRAFLLLSANQFPKLRRPDGTQISAVLLDPFEGMGH